MALVNAAAVERYFGNRDPIGQQISFWGSDWQIVGVIGNERFAGVDREAEPAVYPPLSQAAQSSAVLLVRTSRIRRRWFR